MKSDIFKSGIVSTFQRLSNLAAEYKCQQSKREKSRKF